MSSNTKQLRKTVKALGPHKPKKAKNWKPPARPKVAKGEKFNKPDSTHVTLPYALY